MEPRRRAGVTRGGLEAAHAFLTGEKRRDAERIGVGGRGPDQT